MACSYLVNNMTEVQKEKWEIRIAQALSCFIEKNIDKDLVSGIDDIILNYIAGILDTLDTNEDDNFDVDQFVEMLDAYFPGFAQLDKNKVCKWMHSLSAELSSKSNKTSTAETSLESLWSLTSPVSSQCATSDEAKRPNRTCSTSSDKENQTLEEKLKQDLTVSSTSDSKEVFTHKQEQILLEMFPAACCADVKRCLMVAKGDLDAATQLLLAEAECVTAPTQAQKPCGKKTQNDCQNEDKNLREHIIQKYAYVDQDDDAREHRPLLPKYESKKLVRYRNNQVVSTKGERFTEIKRRTEGEELKKLM